jgi:hypothetical protein
VRTHDVRDARRFSVHDFGAEFSEPLLDVFSILELLKLAVTNDTDAITVTESWLMRHVRAMRNGTAREHTSEESKHFQERQRKRLKLAQEEKKKKKKQKKQKEKSEEEKCTTVE